MELRHLRYFVAVAEELHFGRAAQRLGISQPPLSHQIKQLEHDLGATLFERTRHRVELTPVGMAMLAEAYPLLEHADRLRTVARQVRPEFARPLNVACLSSVFFDVLPPILDRFRTQQPLIRVTLQDMESATALSALLEEKMDVAFVRIERVRPPLRARRIMSDHFIAAVPENHSLARRGKIALKALAQEALVVYSRRMAPSSHDRIVDACERAGFTPNLAYRGATIQSQLGFVACGLGIALVPSLVRNWRVPRVVYRSLEQSVQATPVSLVWHGRNMNTAIRLFLDTAQKAYPETAPPCTGARIGNRLPAHASVEVTVD